MSGPTSVVASPPGPPSPAGAVPERRVPGSRPESDQVRIGRSLARLSRLLEQASSAAGLTLAQYRVLVFVADRPQRASALAAKVDVQRATLSTIVAGLERAGLLQRAAVEEDGRGVQLQLTPGGRQALAGVERALDDRLAEVVSAGGVDAPALACHLEGMLRGFETVTDRQRA